MLCLKKVYTDELLQLAILLSLLRTEQNSDLIQVPALAGIGSEENWQMGRPYISRDTRVHPKSIDAMLINDHQDLFNDLNSLGRYSPSRWRQHVTAYVGLTNSPPADQRHPLDDRPPSRAASPDQTDSRRFEDFAEAEPSASSNSSTRPDSPDSLGVAVKAEIKEEVFDNESDDGSLTEQDMELIEILFKQDVDMGFTIADWHENSTSISPHSPSSPTQIVVESTTSSSTTSPSTTSSDLFDQSPDSPHHQHEKKIKSPLLSVVKGETKLSDVKEEEKPDLWAGKSYTIDLETGEFIVKDEGGDSSAEEDETPSSLLPPSDFSLEEALDLVGLNDGFEDFLERVTGGDDHDDSELGDHDARVDDVDRVDRDSSSRTSGSDRSREEGDLTSELDILDDMIQTPTYHHHHRSYQGRVGYSRTVSMEQRWQDLASLLSLPEHQQGGYPPHHPLHPHHPLGYHQAATVPHHHPASSAGGGSGGGGVAAHHHHHHHPAHPHHHLNPHHHHPAVHHPAAPAKGPGATGGVTSAPSTPLAASAAEYGSPLGPNNIGSAVASSMNLMTNSSEPMGGEAGAVTNFKMENPHDMMYYQQQNSTTSEMNPSTEGFLSSILNDEDLQLMDMAMNEGMYTMRMLEGASGAGSAAASGPGATGGGGGDSDSAVSSMGSERVPSLASDTEWMETNSDSGHTSADHYSSEYAASAFSKYKWYDYGYNRHVGADGGRVGSGGSSSGSGGPVAQKKHHMYGKRVFHDPGVVPHSLGVAGGGGVATGPIKMELGAVGGAAGASGLSIHAGSPYAGATASPTLDARLPGQSELKYSCSVEFSRNLSHQTRPTPAQLAAHNHTYHLTAEDCNPQQRPLTRDKRSSSRKSEEEQHLTRDERRARALNIPLAVDDIINLPMDEFNERLSKYDLSENQLSLIRDIRRRGKNKVAAQNCRKRKLDQILSLADEVKQMKDRKQRLLHERQVLLSERHRIKNKYAQLYRHIFQSLRDAEGNPYSPHEWSLQQTADGSVILVPRSNQTMLGPSDSMASTSRKDHHHQHHPRNNSSSNA